MKGSQYQMNSPTMAVESGGSNGRMQLVTVHKGALIEVAGEPQASGLVDVIYDGRVVAMFEQDIEDRGERVLAESSLTETQRVISQSYRRSKGLTQPS